MNTTTPGITVDDTGARHKGSNAVCAQIGNDDLAWFGTTGSKSRLNLLDLLRAGHTDYVVNEETSACSAALIFLTCQVLIGIPGPAQRPERVSSSGPDVAPTALGRSDWRQENCRPGLHALAGCGNRRFPGSPENR
jgi:hypothetical protein